MVLTLMLCIYINNKYIYTAIENNIYSETSISQGGDARDRSAADEQLHALPVPLENTFFRGNSTD